MSIAPERRERLEEDYRDACQCTRCPQLARTRTSVVYGSGNADADLMFIGEAPGANEDQQGVPFVGQAGKLLEQLLNEIGLDRQDVFIANTLMCRPPGNRDPLPSELSNCQEYLFRKLDLIQPRVICSLGNFSTKLLRGDNTGITKLHGEPEIRTIGPRTLRLCPLYHPAAALYTRSLLDVLRADFARIPEILALPLPPQPALSDAIEPADPDPLAEEIAAGDAGPPPKTDLPEPGQLGLF